MVLRFTAAIPATASAVVFALTIVILTAGSNTSSANDNYWIALNTSGLGGNLIQVSAADPSSSDPLGGLINSIPGLDSVLDNITQGVGNGLSDVQGELLGSLTSGLGVKDFYFLYVSRMCEGSMTGNGVNADKCYSYSDESAGLLNITRSIPSSFNVANAQVSVPLIKSLQSLFETVVNVAVGGSTAMMVLLVIGCVAAGLTAIGSVLGFLRAKSRLLVILTLGFSTLAATIFLLFAIVATVLIAAGTGIIGGTGSGLGLSVENSSSFLAIIWVAAVLAVVAGSFWFCVWFVEFRKTALSRRRRSPHEVGNWRGILGEVKRDLKTDGHFPQSEELGENSSRPLKEVMV